MTEPINANLPPPELPSTETPPVPPPADPSAPTAEQQMAQLKDLLLRRAAEFENYKRRVEQESSAIVRMANEGLIRAFIPIVDDLERSLKAGKENHDFAAFYKGVEMIAQKMMKVLESQGVKSFETVGTPFDVLLHDALMQLPRTDVPPATVLEEVQKGYSMHDKVIRHARVIVSAPPPDGTPEEQKD